MVHEDGKRENADWEGRPSTTRPAWRASSLAIAAPRIRMQRVDCMTIFLKPSRANRSSPRKCLGAIPDTSISEPHVARELTAIVARTEFTCNAPCSPASTGTSSPPASRYKNAFVESFNGRMRDEFLNETLFFDLDDARTKIAAWRQTFD